MYKNRTAAYLWCMGWFEVHGMMVSVKVGFLYTEFFFRTVHPRCVYITSIYFIRLVVYRNFKACGSLVNGDVEVVQGVVSTCGDTI